MAHEAKIRHRIVLAAKYWYTVVQPPMSQGYGSIIENRAYGPRGSGNYKFKNFVARVNGHCIDLQKFSGFIKRKCGVM